MRKVIIILLLLVLRSMGMNAQDNSFQYKFKEKKNGPFNKLDVALTAGSTGIGIDLASPVTDFMQVRTGFTYMPKFEYKMNFPIEVGEGTPEEMNNKFEKLSGFLEKFTGHQVDNNIDMIGTPRFCNFKLMLDFFPLHNKRWHVTAGFYAGASTIGEAYNTTADMPSLFAVTMYNNIYDRVKDSYDNDRPLITIGEMTMYASDDMMQKLESYGRMGIPMGKKSDGSTYRMEPDANSMVHAKMKVNRFRPYLGLGYGTSMLENNRKYHFSVDCGVMMWGGSPSIITHDGTDLSKDVVNVPGKVGNYVNIAKRFKIFPVVEFRLSRRLF